MNRLIALAVLSCGLSAPAFAQHADHAPPPPTAPPKPAEASPKAHNQDARTAVAPVPVDGLDPGDRIPPPDAGSDDPPDAPTDFPADAFYPKAGMDRARGILNGEHGGMLQSKIMANLLEYQSRNGEGGYRWEGEGWWGGDIDRLVIRSEGTGGAGRVADAEVQALYSHAVGPYTDVQVGLRHDLNPTPSRTFLALGVRSLLPYQFDAGASVFISDKGQVLGRLEGSYDFLLTQRLALQPRAEFNFAAKDDAATGTGSGLSDAELGLRLRYEIRREFAPYIGVSWVRSFGGAANFAKAAGEKVETTSFLIGLRAWY